MKFISCAALSVLGAYALMTSNGEVGKTPSTGVTAPAAWPESWRTIYRRIELLQKSFIENPAVPLDDLAKWEARRIQSKGQCFYINGLPNGNVSNPNKLDSAPGDPVQLVICPLSHAGQSGGYFRLPPQARLTGAWQNDLTLGEVVKIAWLTQPEEDHWPDMMEFATLNYMTAYEDHELNPAEYQMHGISVKEYYKVELWGKEGAMTTYALDEKKHSNYRPRKFVPNENVQIRVSSPTAQYHDLVSWHVFRNGTLVQKLPVSENEFISLPKDVGQYVAMIIASAPRGGLRVSNYTIWRMRD